MKLHLFLPVVLCSAALVAGIARRLRLPGVVGEIGAGVILGPSLLGYIPTEASDPVGFATVQELAEVGMCVLLFRVGLETHLDQFRSVARSASSLALAGMVLPFLFGWGALRLVGYPDTAATIVGAALTATSIGVTVSVLSELGARQSREGTLMMGAAILDDILGLVLLAVIVGALTPGANPIVSATVSVAQAVGLLAAALYLGRPLAQCMVRVARWSKSRAALLVLAFSYLLILAYTAQTIGLGMILGAYAAGLAFSQHPERDWVEGQLVPLTGLLTPLFFVLIGASIELSEFNVFTVAGQKMLGMAVLLLVLAVGGKLLTALTIRAPGTNGWAVGCGLVPRGEVGFVFAQVGLATQAIDPGLFTSLAAALLGTTILGPVLLRIAWRQEGSQALAT